MLDHALVEKFGMKIAEQGARFVRHYLVHPYEIDEIKVKTKDDTLVTSVDKACGVFMGDLIKKEFYGVSCNIEDAVGVQSDSEDCFYVDPVDGTRAFAAGVSPTVIFGWYSRDKRQVLSCAVADMLGRIWFNWDEQTNFIAPQTSERVLRVSKHEISGDSIVFLDHARAFTNYRNNKPLTNKQAGMLFQRLNRNYKVLMPGTNGLHQALVAQGNQSVAGAITTAIGGPHDVCGVRLVLNAGGAARALRVDTDKGLIDADPLDVESYDVLVVGNNELSVDILSEHVLEAATK